MKAVLIFFLFAILASASAQGKIEGAGKFKIGKTNLSVIKEIEDELHIHVKNMTTDKEYSAFCEIHNDYVLYEAQTDTTTLKNRPWFAAYPSDYKVYFLTKYQIDKLVYTHISLTFHNGVLIQFHSDGGAALERRLKSKYGEPVKVFNSMQNVQGREGGVNFESRVQMTILRWINDSIIANSASMQNTIRVEPTYIYFEVGNDLEVHKADTVQELMRKRIFERNMPGNK